MPSWRLVAAWLLALVATTAITWQAVSLADSQVGAEPAGIVAVPEGGTATTSPGTGSTTTSIPATTTPTAGTSSTTVTTSAPTDTQASETWQVRTITTAGGTVIVRHRPGEVELQAATPLPGFEMEIDDTGPSRVRVEFESASADIRVDVEPSGDSIDVEITG